MQQVPQQCPLCGTELSKVKLQEIEAKLHTQEQARLAKTQEAEQLLRHKLE